MNRQGQCWQASDPNHHDNPQFHTCVLRTLLTCRWIDNNCLFSTKWWVLFNRWEDEAARPESPAGGHLLLEAILCRLKERLLVLFAIFLSKDSKQRTLHSRAHQHQGELWKPCPLPDEQTRVVVHQATEPNSASRLADKALLIKLWGVLLSRGDREAARPMGKATGKLFIRQQMPNSVCQSCSVFLVYFSDLSSPKDSKQGQPH